MESQWQIQEMKEGSTMCMSGIESRVTGVLRQGVRATVKGRVLLVKGWVHTDGWIQVFPGHGVFSRNRVFSSTFVFF